MHRVADNIWVLRYPLSLLGTQIGRTVTLLQLASGDVLIHSTGPFGRADVDGIYKLGRPAALIEATLFHDTFAARGVAAFLGLPYAAPPGLAMANTSIASLAEQWRGEFDALELSGMPSVREYVFLHRATRTLIVADLVFNFGPSATRWTRAFFRWGAGIREYPGMSRLFRAVIRDRAAFANSVRQMLDWDFDRIIVGHGDIIETNGKAKLNRALARHGLAPAGGSRV